MNIRRAGIAIGLALGAVGVIGVLRRHIRLPTGYAADGGVLMGDVGVYDQMSRWFLGSLFRGISADVAAVAPLHGRVLEVGCGPGLLSIRLARSHGLEVTGLDLDPAMIERANANAVPKASDHGPTPTFVTSDVASMPFEDAAFDVVVSTLSMHHWADRDAALREIARVLRPGGRVLIWDIKPGTLPFHPKTQGGHADLSGLSLRPVNVTDWRWPGPLTLAQRFELERV